MKDITKFGLGALIGAAAIISGQKLMSIHRKHKSETPCGGCCNCGMPDCSSHRDPMPLKGHPSPVPDIVKFITEHEKDEEDLDELARLMESLGMANESKGLLNALGT